MKKRFMSLVVSAAVALSSFVGMAAFADEVEVTEFSPDESYDAAVMADDPQDTVIYETPVADEAPEMVAADETSAVDMITSYTVNFTCALDGWPRYDYAVFNLYSARDELLDSHTVYIDSTDSFSVTFDVPAAPVGTVYYLEVSGVDSIDYYAENYPMPLADKLPLYTYVNDGDGSVVSSADMTVHIRTQGIINIYVDGKYVGLSSPAIFEGSSIIAPLSEIAEAIGITDCTYFPQYESVKVKTGDYEMLVNIGFSYITVFGEDKALNVPVSNINSLTYIELRPFVESFGSTLEFYDSDEYIDIHLTKSPLALESIASLEQRVNFTGVNSKTNYMIWVNKSKFRLSVFEGYAGNWKWVKDFTVGIGAPNSETITGSFEYQYPVSSWNYSDHYVGPVMVFYGNYALHSTFLNYDGTPYNNNVGMKISLGCVRCQKKYIDWMFNNIPLGTRILVTEW